MARIDLQSQEPRRARAVKAAVRTAVTIGISLTISCLGAAHGQAAAGAAQAGFAQAGQRCFEATGTHHAKTLIGNTFYKFTHSAEFCTDGTNVVSAENREHRFTDASAFASFGDVIEDSVSRMPEPEVTSIKKARVDNCVPVKGCISSKYPFVRLTLRADGTWFATTGESESS